MKKALILFLSMILMTLVLVSCGGPAETTAPADPALTPEGDIIILDGGESLYQVTYPMGATKNNATGELFKNALTVLRKGFRAYGYPEKSIYPMKEDIIPIGEKDTYVPPKYEILLGETNRKESEGIVETLAFNEAVMKVVGQKIVIIGKSDALTAQAVSAFAQKFMSGSGDKIVIPADLNEKVILDMTECSATGKSYEEMAEDVLTSFNTKYWNGQFLNESNWFWDRAEMLEAYIDVYEATKDKKDLDRCKQYAKQFISLHGSAWTWNEYNDDIMWACIAFSRLYLLTKEQIYLTYAKTNFDATYKTQVDTKLGGGMWWKKDQTTKNSCVNCPAAIAACLLGKATKNNEYYDKAKSLIQWELDEMYEPNGKIYDAYPLSGKKSTWASTYNQGTFIGACTLYYQYSKDEAYLGYANTAANYAMTKLTSGGILDNGEASTDNGDLPGFKGIFTRWFYRLAKETDNVDYLVFLQRNAQVAYENRNSEGLIWTKWNGKTPEPDKLTKENGYVVFGMSTALALLHNCHQWW